MPFSKAESLLFIGFVFFLLYFAGMRLLPLAGGRTKGAVQEPSVEKTRHLYIKKVRHLPVIVLAQIDNWFEIRKLSSGTSPVRLLDSLESVLAQWAVSLGGYLTYLTEGRYLMLLLPSGLRQARREKFAILDTIRTLSAGQGATLTLSLGCGQGDESLTQSGALAQSALDLAQERGGDQVVLQSPEKVYFYGGQSFSREKRTRVKARHMARLFREMVLKSDQVVIMGHVNADYDSLGAAFAFGRAVRDLGKKVYIIRDVVNPTFDQLMALFPPEIKTCFLTPEELRPNLPQNTLLLIVDTHKPSLLPEPKLLARVDEIMLVDHHRRSTEFIAEATLVYLEPSASSTAELVAEMLQYLEEDVNLGFAEATALLAGIVVDTKDFVYQTGARTFAAAAYLRGKGADPLDVQKLLQDDLQTVIQKAKVISHARILYGEIALGVSRIPTPGAQVLAAKTADAMLHIAGVNAAFVLWSLAGGTVISARSRGEIDVQMILEQLSGGGHFTVAAAQLPVATEKAEEQLLDILKGVFQKEEGES